MKHLIKTVLAAGAVCLAAPAVAQDAASMTCEEFMAMDTEGQSTAMAMLQAESDSAGGATSASGTGSAGTTGTAGTTDTGTTSTTGTGTDTGSTGTAGSTSTTATGSTGTAATTGMAGTDNAAAAGTEATETDRMMDEQMTALMAACEADPSMLAMDAMNADG